jgi:hypothetical protein
MKLRKLPYLVVFSVLASFSLLPLSVIGGESMGVLKAEPAYPFSGFSGQLLFKGEPASNAKITRKYELLKDQHEETITADQDGNFSFDSILIQYRVPLIASHDFLARQQLFVDYEGETYQIWGGSKTGMEEYSEFGGKPSRLRCELTDDPRKVKNEESGFIGTSCHWEID